MIEYNYEIDFVLKPESYYSDWLSRIISSETKQLGVLDFIFCSDEYLLDMNMKFLNHDTYTDIITFDYCEGDVVAGDIFISIERVRDNANEFGVNFDEELLRVMAHGVLHLMGYKDKTDMDSDLMRKKEEEKIKLFHVEH
tara:strand:- start:43589 stop:44008 length:420 start_codon:yes stop_codon:yes gene_type:complete